MRKFLVPVLFGLSAFLLVCAVLAVVWAPGVAKKTPIDVNQVTHLDGTVKKLNTDTGELEENPVKIQSISRTDTDASDSKYAVWFASTCVVIDIDNAPDCVDGNDPRLVSATTDTFATDRVTALASNKAPGLPPDATPHEGLINKWPFDSEKKDYPYWSSTLSRALPAVYKGTKDVAGVETYVYEIKAENEPIDIAEGIPGTYTDLTTIYVEPRTGAIQQQTDSMQQYLADGTQVVDLNIGFTDAQLKKFADDANANILLLDLMLVWTPIVGFVAGGLCLLAGIVVILGKRRSRGSHSEDRELVKS